MFRTLRQPTYQASMTSMGKLLFHNTLEPRGLRQLVWKETQVIRLWVRCPWQGSETKKVHHGCLSYLFNHVISAADVSHNRKIHGDHVGEPKRREKETGILSHI